MIEITQIPALKDNYIYIVIDKDTKKTACIDPSESQPVLLFLEQNGITLDYILNTHHHSDHVGGNLELKKETGCQVVGPEIDKKRIPGIDICLKHNEEFKLGKTVLNVFEIPGHTLGHICFYSKTNNALFCGDTLHHGGVLTHIRFSDINVFCHIMFNYRRNIRAMITFNDTVLFQKISNEEHMVLLANENRDND